MDEVIIATRLKVLFFFFRFIERQLYECSVLFFCTRSGQLESIMIYFSCMFNNRFFFSSCRKCFFLILHLAIKKIKEASLIALYKVRKPAVLYFFFFEDWKKKEEVYKLSYLYKKVNIFFLFVEIKMLIIIWKWISCWQVSNNFIYVFYYHISWSKWIIILKNKKKNERENYVISGESKEGRLGDFSRGIGLRGNRQSQKCSVCFKGWLMGFIRWMKP